MWFPKLLRIFFLLLPIITFGQTIEENLQYVNTQFEQYNDFETSFAVDKLNKKIVCRDKFGTYSASLQDIEIRIDTLKKSIGLFCIDNSTKCISSTQRDGNEGVSLTRYTMELTQKGKLISNANVVIEKLLSVKKEVIEVEAISLETQNESLEDRVEREIQNINVIFQDHSHYQNDWSFDWENLMLINKSSSCEVRVPIAKMTIEYFEKDNQQEYRKGFVFKSANDNIYVKCESYENNVSKTHEYVDSLKFAEAVINSIKNIQTIVSKKQVANPALAKTVDQHLYHINEEFKKYNNFNTRFFLDVEKRELVWVQEFGESRAPIDLIDFKANYNQGWLVIFCKEGLSRCVSSTGPKGGKIQNNEYSMSLKEDEKVIDHLDKIINEFRALIKAIDD